MNRYAAVSGDRNVLVGSGWLTGQPEDRISSLEKAFSCPIHHVTGQRGRASDSRFRPGKLPSGISIKIYFPPHLQGQAWYVDSPP